jgi:hypothetical protein
MEKIFQKHLKKCSAKHPVFLLIVEGVLHPQKNQEGGKIILQQPKTQKTIPKGAELCVAA